MKSVSLNIPSIHCGHCAMTIKNELADLLGVKSVEVDVQKKSAVVNFDDPATEEGVVSLLKEIGYPPVL